MNNYKALVFFDLDGTLLDADSKIPKENHQAILQLKKNNILPLIASGRSPKEIKQIIKGTPIDSYVSLNGQFNVVENEVTSKHAIPLKQIQELMVLSESLGHSLACYTEAEYATCYSTASMEKLYCLDHAPLPKISAEFHKEHEIYMVYLFSEDEGKDLVYREKFADTFTFFRDSPYSMAVVLKGRSKKAGIQEIIKILDLAHLPTYAFGDGNNDLGMFEAVNTAIAMDNASAHVKSHADYVTKSHLNDGIRFGLKHFELLK
ncbi:Cof-type HAD-IIB family hydrolase [Candidatus Enterococcus ikei]|uniref:Cof-type HAD-IIB family hydrolase n=1 Tax=Candidatus Enterococcus ikei TaxID=2815326 RepID=A0ABS3GVR9_9ENTE|nr:Cof-type HAD-IIB family hydrolase [Enterococcus sp. DIV0869a]MBO0439270.1 Cof-type HAD-IIB family hydrolase [Enterococcus sp. DIV0869a]